MEEGWAGMTSDKIDFRVAEAWNIDDVLFYAGCVFPANLDDFKIVAVQGKRMRIPRLIGEYHAVALALLNHKRVRIWPRFIVDRPTVEVDAITGNFLERQLEGPIGFW